VTFDRDPSHDFAGRSENAADDPSSSPNISGFRRDSVAETRCQGVRDTGQAASINVLNVDNVRRLEL